MKKNGFLGTFYEGSTYADKAVIYVGGTGENRSTVEERASKLCRREGFSVLALGYYLWEGLSKIILLSPWITAKGLWGG